MLNTREAAEFLGVCVGTLKDWRARPRVKVSPPAFYRYGYLIRYSLSDLENWLKRKRVGGFK